jgi:hypothetical protein
MASFITAGNATNGLQVSSDNTGILELKSGTGSGTTAVTVDTSQNVGVGTSSPLMRLHASGSGNYVAGLQSSNTFALLAFQASGTGGSLADPNVAIGGTGDALYMRAGGAERARIDASGSLLLNTTSSSVTNRAATFNANNIASRDTLGLKQDSNSLFNICSLVSTTSGTRFHVGFGDGTTFTERGSISTNGTSTTYSTSSDYRLKENITPITGAMAKVAQMRPVDWTWKENGAAGQGFIAHELQAVIPDAVVGEKDEVDENGNPRYQSVDTSFLVATLTAAIQELNAKVEAQAAEIAALKGAA